MLALESASVENEEVTLQSISKDPKSILMYGIEFYRHSMVWENFENSWKIVHRAPAGVKTPISVHPTAPFLTWSHSFHTAFSALTVHEEHIFGMVSAQVIAGFTAVGAIVRFI